jgi:phosphoserine phosphatase RsbU/P
VTAPVVRRLRLPAAQSSPAVARAAVNDAITDVGLSTIRDEALLLTTELITNAVVHAGTEMELEILASSEAISVMVLDNHCGPLSLTGWDATSPSLAATLGEGGRGLLLVDRLADRWGTLHHSGGKGIWFRLERSTIGPPVPAPPGLTSAPGSVPPPESFAALGSLQPAADAAALTEGSVAAPLEIGQDGGGALAEIGAHALNRLCDATNATSAILRVDQADGHGPRTVAIHGKHQPVTDDPLRIPLGLSRPWRGELVLSATATPYARPLAELTAERLALLVENYRLRRVDTERRAWLTFLAEAGELLAHSLDVDLTLALIPRLVVPRLGQWCAVHTTVPAGTADDLVLAAATHADETQLPTLRTMLRTAHSQIHEVLRTDGAVALPAPIDGYAVPLTARGKPLGTLTVGRGTTGWPRTEEITVVEDVARRAALAIDNARIHADRRAIAHELQRSLLPPRLPKIDGVEFGAEYVATGEGVDVGGDFYDVLELSDNSWLVIVGDVSGKGVQAAAVTGLVRNVTRALVQDGRPLPEALGRLNETLVERGGGRFCTLALAAVTRRPDGILDLCLYLAGHDRPILVRPDRSAILVGECGTALGLLDTVKSPEALVTLAGGETLVFYTDGVTERRRGRELFGQERLRRQAAALAGYPAEVIAARLRAATIGFSREEPRDDIAIFALRNDSPAGPSRNNPQFHP